MESFLPSGCFFGSGESEGLFSPAISILKVVLSYQHRGIPVLRESRCVGSPSLETFGAVGSLSFETLGAVGSPSLETLGTVGSPSLQTLGTLGFPSLQTLAVGICHQKIFSFIFLVYHHYYFLPCGDFPRLFIDEQCIWKI